MLKNIVGTSLTIACNHCNDDFVMDTSNISIPFLEEFGEYQNFATACPYCSAIEIFNMNIPINDIDEPFVSGELPEEEEIQRYYVRYLMRLVREDFKGVL